MADGPLTQVVATKCAIVRDGKILLLRESPNHSSNTKAGMYQFPGGRIEPGEHVQDGLRREILEETGLEIKVGEPFYVDEWFPVVHGNALHIVAIFFDCEYVSGDVVLSEEHDDYQWANAKESAALNLMKPDDKIAAAYFAKRTGAQL